MKAKNWENKCVRQGEEGKYLQDGWEPFAVSPQDTSYTFLNTSSHKREVEHQTTNLIYLRKRKRI